MFPSLGSPRNIKQQRVRNSVSSFARAITVGELVLFIEWKQIENIQGFILRFGSFACNVVTEHKVRVSLLQRQTKLALNKQNNWCPKLPNFTEGREMSTDLRRRKVEIVTQHRIHYSLWWIYPEQTHQLSADWLVNNGFRDAWRPKRLKGNLLKHIISYKLVSLYLSKEHLYLSPRYRKKIMFRNCTIKIKLRQGMLVKQDQYVEKSYIHVKFRYLCPNYNIYVQIAIYIYIYPSCNIWIQMVIYMSKNVNRYVSKCCHFQTVRCIYVTQFFDIYIWLFNILILFDKHIKVMQIEFLNELFRVNVTTVIILHRPAGFIFKQFILIYRMPKQKKIWKFDAMKRPNSTIFKWFLFLLRIDGRKFSFSTEDITTVTSVWSWCKKSDFRSTFATNGKRIGVT